MELPLRMTLETLRKRVHAVEPAALLVEPRILRRVIRLDRRLPGLGLSVPHRKTYTIERDRLLVFVDRTELELLPGADLPRHVILLATPEDEALDAWEPQRLLQHYARLLFHAGVHAALDELLHHASAAEEFGQQRRKQIGAIEFAEIRSVLLKDDFLFPAPDDLETYIEFVAVYLELRYFAPRQVALYFPAIRDWDAIDRLVSRDIDHARLFARLRLTDDETTDDAAREEFSAQQGPPQLGRPELTLVELRRFQARAERAAAVGNSIKSAILHTRAANRAPVGYAEETHLAACQELRRFAKRLQQILEHTKDETNTWYEVLSPLLAPAAEGFWSTEARLLYDLQKVCVEHERGVYRLDLIDWIRTRGKRPLRRPLPLLRETLVSRHLRTALRRVATARLTPPERERLSHQLEQIVAQVEQRSRDHLRPVIVKVLDDVGLTPQNVPEEVARRKLVEELLDRVVERSYLSMADVRDALSKNDLKLPDVLSVRDLWAGDRLLRADKKLDHELDGVYRRGAMYQRWPQTLSSLAFGTSFGRFLTRHIVLPFGGAYLTLAFLLYVVHFFQGHHHHQPDLLAPDLEPVVASVAPSHEVTAPPATVNAIESTPPDAAPTPHADVGGSELSSWEFYGAVFLVGLWMYLLIHRPGFRAWNLAVLHQSYRIGRQVLVEAPTRILRSEIVQRILHSQTFGAIHSYLLRPAFVTALLRGLLWLSGYAWSERATFELFLVVNLFLNSPIGRTAAEVTTDFLVRAWHELRMRVIAAVLQWIVAVFRSLAMTLERVVYTVDEWLRFRAGDSRMMQTIKLLGGVGWFFVAYVVVFVFTLLVEPQINPIKHFPVVTVAHKLIIPTGPVFVEQLTPYLGRAQAHTLVWTTIWLIPGVFGFLVWELKENWKLYAANRARSLRRVSIGSHGETMVQLLRPGFHSGTLPKTYSTLRRAARKGAKSDREHSGHRKHIVLHHAEVAVQRFVERGLINLLEVSGSIPVDSIKVTHVRTATNRIDVELTWSSAPHNPAVLTWEDDGQELIGSVTQLGWIALLPEQERTVFATALTGLFQYAGVAQACGPLPIFVRPPIARDHWASIWTPASGLTGSDPHSLSRDDRASMKSA